MAQNPYFTYITGTKPSGAAYAHRTDVQEWVVHKGVKLTIYVQGPLPNGQHNAFAKKHLMTTTGGDHDGSPKAKLTAISTKRRNDTIASTNQARQDKLTALTAFAPAQAVQYNAANDAFAVAILAIKSSHWQDQGVPPVKVAHTNVRFTDNIIYNQLYNKNDITTTNRMSVMVMKDKLINTYHVFHGAPYDATYPNAGT
jgi:hypothetical protein